MGSAYTLTGTVNSSELQRQHLHNPRNGKTGHSSCNLLGLCCPTQLCPVLNSLPQPAACLDGVLQPIIPQISESGGRIYQTGWHVTSIDARLIDTQMVCMADAGHACSQLGHCWKGLHSQQGAAMPPAASHMWRVHQDLAIVPLWRICRNSEYARDPGPLSSTR